MEAARGRQCRPPHQSREPSSGACVVAVLHSSLAKRKLLETHGVFGCGSQKATALRTGEVWMASRSAPAACRPSACPAPHVAYPRSTVLPPRA
eukprot:364487-Chlamydomonas_euryale.AAC.24